MTTRFLLASGTLGVLVLLVGLLFSCAPQAFAQQVTPGLGTTPAPSPILFRAPGNAGTVGSRTSPQPSPAATSSATPLPQIQIQQPVDLTQNTGVTRSNLAIYLQQHPLQSTSPLFFIQRAIHNAVDHGVPANVIVLLLLFPVTASLIAIFRHVIGLRGFGVYTPAVLAVAFISTGISRGLILFTIIFAATMIGRAVINRLKLQYLPRAALLLWLVSMVFFGLVLATPYLSVVDVISVGVFPLLVLILLSENFLEAQQLGNPMSAIRLTVETVILAVISTLFMRTLSVQEFVILHPEVTIVSVLVINILVGKYTGLRVTELLRFKSMLDPEE